jgi:hypothetical protein
MANSRRTIRCGCQHSAPVALDAIGLPPFNEGKFFVPIRTAQRLSKRNYKSTEVEIGYQADLSPFQL